MRGGPRWAVCPRCLQDTRLTERLAAGGGGMTVFSTHFLDIKPWVVCDGSGQDYLPDSKKV